MEILCRTIQDQLMWIDLDDEDCKGMIHQEIDTKGQPTVKKTLDIYFNSLYCVSVLKTLKWNVIVFAMLNLLLVARVEFFYIVY